MALVSRYLFRETLTPFIVATFVITFVGVMSQVLRLSEKVFTYDLSAAVFVKVLFCATMPLLTFTVPAALLLAVLITITRMSSDSEVIALRASGISLWQMLPPVLLLSIIATATTAWVSSYGSPWGLKTIERIFFDVTKEKAAALLPEGAFRDDFFGITMFVEKVGSDGSRLEGVFLADERDPQRAFAVTAKAGAVAVDTSGASLALHLEEATVDWIGAMQGAIQRAQFDELDLTLVSGLPSAPDAGPFRMSADELREFIARTSPQSPKLGRLKLAYYKRYAQPFVCLAFGVLGLALGISSPRSGRSKGITLAVILLLLYYVIVRGMDATGERSVLPAQVAAWGPTLLFAALAIYVFAQKAKDKEPIWTHYWEKLTA